MIVLGISPLDKDATVTLMRDGRVVAAVAEERLSRVKMHAGFPREAITMVLDRAGVTAADVDKVVYAFLAAPEEEAMMRRNFAPDYALNRGARKRLGELIAADQSGPGRLEYGTPRDYVTDIKAALPSGEIVSFGSSCVKNVAGYAVEKLLIGSMGTLAAILELETPSGSVGRVLTEMLAP
jgi:FAD/FMN-containing dehydrogenase